MLGHGYVILRSFAELLPLKAVTALASALGYFGHYLLDIKGNIQTLGLKALNHPLALVLGKIEHRAAVIILL